MNEQKPPLVVVYRGFIVWGTSLLVLLGAFVIFASTGWPGTPNGCINEVPDGCYCEAFVRTDVLRGAPGVRQPVNTWFNLYAIVTSLVVAIFVMKDRKAFLTSAAPNLLRSTSWIPDLYIFAVLFLGLGSMWFHGSLTEWGGVVDGASMYIYAAFLGFYSLRRLWNQAWFFWLGYPLTIALFTYLHTVLPSFLNIMALVAFYVVVEVIIWVKTKRVMQGRWQTAMLWCGAVLSIWLATFFWVASSTGNFMCNPTSWFQPHGMLWHPLAGVMAMLLYFYWREASD